PATRVSRPSLHAALPISDERSYRLRAHSIRSLGSLVTSEHRWLVLGDFNTMGCATCQPVVTASEERAQLKLAAERVGLRLIEPRSEEHTSELQSRENIVC